jgi:CRP-like cAMP-binding protein
MAIYCLPTLLFLFVSSPAVAFVIEAIRGAGTLVVDVLAISALQRSLQSDVLARVFGAFNAFVLAAVLVGASVAPPVLDNLGLEPTLWLTGAALPAVCLLGWPALRRMDAQAAERMAALRPRVDLLAACDLFAAVSEGALEQLAGAAREVTVAPGEAVVTEGEPADAFFVVISGAMSVTARAGRAAPVALRELEPGDYFGEIGLIEGIARTATVTAAEPSQVLRIAGDEFIAALTESSPSAALLEGASMRLRHSHPTLTLTQAGLGESDGR